MNIPNINKIYLTNINKIYLTNNDFINGTYRITKSGNYILKENIIFSPNSKQGFIPTIDQIKSEKYKVINGPYILGFFAAITVECENVIIDLAGYTIQQGREFYLRQRFFNIIELSNSPFIPKQGPGNFGNTLLSANNCIIRNGRLGLSSHSSIHGNNVENLSLLNLILEDFEVGGISLNGSKNIKIDNIKIQNSLGINKKVPVNGRFSSFVFLTRQLENIGKTNFKMKVGPNYLELDVVKKELILMREKVISEFMSNTNMGIQQFSTELYNQFGNPSGNPDGSGHIWYFI